MKPRAGGPAAIDRRDKARNAKTAGDRAGLAVRRTALEILNRVESQAAFADVMLGNRAEAFAPPDRRLLTRLVLGTIAWRGRLDYEIARLCTREAARLEPEVLSTLRLGMFQLRFLDRVPKHAAVDTAVSLARESRATRAAAGLINAVLRRAAVSPAALPKRAEDEAEYLAVAYSHPRWLVDKFIEWFGAGGAQALMAADNEAAPNAIRLNLARGERSALLAELRRDGFEIAADGRLPETIILGSAPLLDSPAYRHGLLHVQSEASQLVAAMLAPPPGATVLDCAAAPGGKATHLAEIVGPRGRVVALDSNFAGLRKVRALAGRLRDSNLALVRADAAALPLRPQSCGFVLLDAPCTGLGTLREHPEIRWRLEPGDFRRMGAVQLAMLEGAASIVKPGGVLVYAVCSLAPEEGREVILNLLARHPDFVLDRKPPVMAMLPAAFAADGTMLTRPDRDGLDGFFAARLLRR